jgi:hypothetical protein
MASLLPPPNFPLFPGNTAQFVVTALQSDGVTPFNLTSATVVWTAKLDPASTLNIFSKSIGADVIVTTPTNGQIQTWYRPVDTNALLPNNTIYNFVTVTDGSGNVYTVEKYIVFLRD